ncbi:hypothetical protein BaRGS_00040433 [Batillaria attramentaria]|uniref:Zinc-binding loop region of homing endonuclease domain-containing protein n=1 Tax=Batillaria attramentaria TaxID=370345 RepID=A0ABD0J0D9_9CAEN
MDAMRHRLYVCPGYVLAANGICQLFQGCAGPNGYMRLSYRHPVSGQVTSTTAHRAAVMVARGCLGLPPHLDASHLCHNKACILPTHISLEPREVNCQRRGCITAGQCLVTPPFLTVCCT